ncbi:MAG: phospholipid carrier-dependent glycosyltransferase, partial [Planctomycetota bacterium]
GIDLLLALFSVCAVHAFVVWMEAERQSAPRSGAGSWLVLSAVFCGIAMGAKYTGVMAPAALAATLFITRWRSGAAAGRCLESSLRFVLIAGLVMSHWLVKNAVLLGNPVAPLLPDVFAGADAAQVQRTQALTDLAAQHDLNSLRDYLALPWNVTMGSVGHSPVFSPLFLFMCPLLLLFRTYPRPLRRAALFTGLFALGWILTSTAVRYLLPVLPWACLLLAYWALHAHMGAPVRVAVKTLMLASCVAGVLVSWEFTFSQGGWQVVLGAQDRDDYLSRSHDEYTSPSYGLYRWMNAQLPATARVLLVGETRGFYLERDFIAGSVFDRNVLLDQAEKSADPDELVANLEAMGITHVLLNPGEALRLQPYGMLNTTEDGKRTLLEFWRRHVREVGSFDEPAGDQLANRVTVHAISPLAAEGSELPGYMARLLETP